MRTTAIKRRFHSAHFGVIAVAALLAFSACSGSTTSPGAGDTAASNPKTLILATTTSTQDSGLLDVLVPAFESASGYQVKTVAVGTGQALKMGEEGNADVLLVHAPASEQALVDSGFAVDRRLVMHNHFMVVGPKADPAGIASSKTAAEAFTKIANAKATFVSRGDASGTETKELSIWKITGITPKGQSWYLQSGQGMGATLQITSQKKGYTLTDDATFLANSANLDLTSLVKGDPLLLNVYHVMSVNPAKWPKVNSVGAKAFADYVTSADGQKLIASFGTAKYGRALFSADAGKNENELK